jgi:acetaldehyde/propanal dehydrogenase
MNVNMVTCGGQATIPMVAAVSRVQAWPTARSSPPVVQVDRPGHPQEHRRIHPHHRGAVEKVGGARKGKAIMAIINPAEPPMMMRNTIYCLTDDEPDHVRIPSRSCR